MLIIPKIFITVFLIIGCGNKNKHLRNRREETTKKKIFNNELPWSTFMNNVT